jgi:DMSO/TMAO reductase YedYZ molybdopterin-dependent catalytic subunit
MAAALTSTAVPAGSLALSGDVKAPRTLDAAELAALPQKTEAVSFQSSKGAEKHAETGVPLASAQNVTP